MNTFLSRLKEIGANLLFMVISLAVVGAIIGLIELTRFIWKPLPGCIYISIVCSYFLFLIVRFIYWLFIQPFRKNKKQ